jgi:hypothetical protein
MAASRTASGDDSMKPAVVQIIRDFALLAPRLLRAAFQVGADRFFAEPSSRLEKFTSHDWLAACLGVDSDVIDRAWIEAVHSGTATRSRLQIRYKKTVTQTPGPSSLFIKSGPPDFAAALFGVLFDLGGNEVSFYQKIRPELPVESPRVYYCEGDSVNYVLLLEDLAERECSFRDLASSCSLDEARSVVTTLARLHAGFWQSGRFDSDLGWVKRLETNRDHRLLNLVRQLSLPISYQKFGYALPEGTREVVPHLMKNYRLLERQWARGPRTLIHGDAHLGNMYFVEGRACLLDWQVQQYGQGMRDVSYFLVNSMPEELRVEHQEKLITHYLATLRACGISFDFDTAWAQYRLQSVYAWIAALVTAPSNFQEEKVVIAGLTRASRAILDLDAIALIREL